MTAIYNENYREKQKALWNEKARNEESTHPDPFQSELELDFMLMNIRGRVLNAGCGSGYETLYSSSRTGFAVGVDFSEKMIEIAKRLERDNVIFRIGDVLNLEKIVEEFGTFDSVTTRRLLINLCSWSDQKKVLEEFRKCLKPDGCLILIEATNEGYHNLNTLRYKLGIPEIKIASYNHLIPLKKFNSLMEKNWTLADEDTMSTYYFLTRVFYPLIEEPKYGSYFARKAALLQRTIGNLDFSSPILMRLYYNSRRS